MVLLLQRRLNGYNEIVEVEESDPDIHGNALGELLTKLGLYTQEGIEELAQVLKIPMKEFEKCATGGYVIGDARENIIYYWRNCRVPEHCIKFLKRQCGEAGWKNAKSEDPDDGDQKDRCG